MNEDNHSCSCMVVATATLSASSKCQYGLVKVHTSISTKKNAGIRERADYLDVIRFGGHIEEQNGCNS